MAGFAQQPDIQCGCGGLGEMDLDGRSLAAVERLIDPAESLVPSAHALKINELFGLNIEKITQLERKDPGSTVTRNDAGEWIASSGAALTIRPSDYVLVLEGSRDGVSSAPSFTHFRSLEGAAHAFSVEIARAKTGTVNYTDNQQRPSPLMFVSENRFACVLRAQLSSEDIAIILHESPVRRAA